LRIFVAVALAVLAAAIPSASTAEEPVQVFLLAGQSNMIGRGLPVSDGTGPVADLLLWRNGAWEPASDPLGPPGDEESGVGPGMTFGIGVLGHEPAGTKIGLIMCAQSSTPISAWKPGRSPFNACRKQARAAGGVVAGIVFLQGEYEALKGDGPDKWKNAFDDVGPGFQREYGPVPFVLGQIGNIDRPFAQGVRDSQAYEAAKFPFVTLVSSVDLPVEDGVHFTVAAAKQLGYRYADAWYTLLQQFPQIDDFSPDQGTPGTTIVITGRNLDSVSGVTFGHAPAGFTIDSSNQITTVIPDNATTGPFSLKSSYGTFIFQDFPVLPVIDALSTESGPPGTKVYVDGKALGKTTSVKLNGQPAKFKVVSGSQVKMWVPVGSTSGAIDVTTPSGSAQSDTPFTVVTG
jgi:Carbohydrate esterase, sialic acid-specific acetylesterase/IPT/TIG domain